MHQLQDEKVQESTLRERLAGLVARHKTLDEDFTKLFDALTIFDSRLDRNAIDSIPEDFEQSSGDLCIALQRLSAFLADRNASDPARGNVAKILTLIGTIAPPRRRPRVARPKYSQLSRRSSGDERLIAGLIEDGLSLAFRNEVLEKRVSSLAVASGSGALDPEPK
jgi:hypothetical protein